MNGASTDRSMPEVQQIPDVDEILQRIKSGVRQRQAELAAAQIESEKAGRFRSTRMAVLLDDLQELASIEEQPFTSRVPVVGRAIVLIRRLWNSVSTRWFVLPMVMRQNEFNEAVVRALREWLEVQDASRLRAGQNMGELIREVANRELVARQLERVASDERQELIQRVARVEQLLAAREQD